MFFFFFLLCVIIVIRAVEYFMSATALKQCRFAMLGVTREVWGNSANAACINPHPFIFISFLSFVFLCTNLFKLHFFFLFFLRCKAMRLSSSACAYCNKATWWFWFSEKRTGLLCFIGTQRAECVRLRRERVSRGEKRNECHACVGSGFGRVWNNDLNMCYSWESSERKVQTKALAVQPCRGHRWRNHKDCETLAVEKSFVKKKKKTCSFNTKCQLLQKSRALLLLEI